MARPRSFDQSKVLIQAMEVFWRKGYEATSLTDILQATGLSKSSLYETFGSKHELFLATFNLYRFRRMEILNEYLNQGETALDAIENFFNSVLEHAENEESSTGCMTCNQAIELAPHDLEFRQLIEQDFQGIEEAFLRAIKRGQADGSITSLEADRSLARFLTVSLQGLHVVARANTGKKRVVDTIDMILKTLQKR